MVAVIGYPGESKHKWKRFTSKAEAVAWLNETGSRLYEESGGCWPAAISSQRVLSEKEAAKIRYRDGRKCYPAESATV